MKQRIKQTIIALFLGMLSQACAADLDPGQGDGDEDADGRGGDDSGDRDGDDSGNKIPAESGKFSHELLADGSTVSTLADATDHEEWQFIELSTGKAVKTSKADTADWDLKFRRFFVLSNGGETADGDVELALVENTEFEDFGFEELEELPDEAWQQDRKDGDADDDDEPDNVFNNGEADWYDYESSTHSLTSRRWLYLIRSTEERIFKMQVLDYYDEAGTPALVSFRWAEVESPQ